MTRSCGGRSGWPGRRGTTRLPLTAPGAAAAAPGTARRRRAAVLGPHGGRPARRPHQMPSVTWLVQSTVDRQDAVDSSQLLAFWMKASGTALLAVERCSCLVRVWMAAQDSCSADRLPYFADAAPRGAVLYRPRSGQR